MPTKILVIHANDFIKVTMKGKIDFERPRRALLKIAEAATPLTDYGIILDTRKTTGELSPTDLWSLAAELSNLGNAFYGKTAVLSPLERFDHAEFFALCAQRRGFPVSAFRSYEDAMEFLLASTI